MFRSNQTTAKNLLLCASSLVSLTACAADDDLAREEELSLAAQQQSLVLQQAETLRDPAGSYFAEVRANGTGCPAGSWNTSISPDGKTFTTTFSKYEVEVTPDDAFDVKDCQLSIKLHSPQGLSFAVNDFYYSGYVLLEKGVNARQIATYYFQGDAATQSEARTELVGPNDDTFTFADSIPTRDLVWSECGVERNLNVRTTLRLQNATPKANGYLNLAAVDGSTKLAFKLAWKTCKPAGTKATSDKPAATSKPTTAAKPSTSAKPSSPASPSIQVIIDDFFGGGQTPGPRIVGAGPASGPRIVGGGRTVTR